MAGHLLQLRSAALRGAAHRTSPDRGPRRRLLAWCLAGLLLGAAALLAARELDLALFPALAGTLGALGAFVGGVRFHALDPVTPQRLAVHGVAPGPASAWSLGLGVAGLPFLAALLPALGFVALGIARGDSPLGVAATILGALLGLVLLVVLAKLGGLLGASLDRRRAAGDWGSALALLLALAASPALFLAVLLPGQPSSPLAALLRGAVEWSPLGAPWAAAGAAAAGDAAGALLRLGLGAVAAVVLVALYLAFARRQHALALFSGGALGPVRLGVFDRFAGTPAGAVAARSTAYWLRDPRYRLLLATVIALPALVLVPLAIVGVPAAALAMIPLPVLAFLIGWTIHNDVAYDGSAVWLHLTSGMSGASDRLGRAAPALIVGVVALALGTLVTGLLTLDWLAALGDLGVAASLLGAGAGIGSIVSATAPYPVARPGDSPFSQPIRTWGAAAAVSPLAAIGALLLAAPAIILLVIAVATGEAGWHLAALAAGLVIGAAAVVAGIRIGGRAFERRASEIMAFAARA